MASSDYEGGTGGKFRKRLLRRASSTPYDRPPSAARDLRGAPPAVVSRSSGWILNLVDPASRVISRNASRLFSSVFRKRLAPPPGENHNPIEDVPEVRPSPEVGERGDKSFDGRLSIHCDGNGRCEQESISGTEDIFELEQLVNQKTFSRSEAERLTELLQSRTVKASPLPSADYKEKGKLDEDSNINPDFMEKAFNHEDKKKENVSVLEDQRTQLITLNRDVSSGVNVNVPAEGFGSPIEIARAYMGSKSLKFVPSSLRLKQGQISFRDKGSPLSFPFGNKHSSSADTFKSAGCFPILPADPENDYISSKPRGGSALYKLPRSSYCRSPALTNTREYSPYQGSYIGPAKPVEWTPSSSNIRHSVHEKALKRVSSDNDVGDFGDVRSVRQKTCLKDLCSSASTSSHGQGYISEIDLKVLENVDGKLPSANVQPVPPQSTQVARKILHQLDKLVPSPRNFSSEKKVTFGGASFSSSSSGALHEGSKKFNGKYCSTKFENVSGRGSSAQRSSTLARIINSASDHKVKDEIEGTPIPSISGAEVTSSFFRVNSAVSFASGSKCSMRSMNSNGQGFSFPSMQKNLILQNAPDDKDESTKAEHAVLSPVIESRETCPVHYVKFAPTSGLIHSKTDTEAPNGPSTEKDVSIKLPAADASMSKPLLSSTMETTTSTSLVANTMGINASVRSGETIIDSPTLELNKGVSASPTLQYCESVSSALTSNGISPSSSNPYLSSVAPRFQFGSGNSTIYSFTGLSAASSSMSNISSMGNGASKFQFGSGSSTSYSFAGVAASSSQDRVSSPVFSSLCTFAEASSVLPISANGILGVNTSSAMNFGTIAASSSGTPATSAANGIKNLAHSSSVYQFGSSGSQSTFGLGSSLPFSYSSQFGLTASGAKPFSSSSFLSSSSGASSSLFGSSLSQSDPASFSATIPSLPPPSFQTTSVPCPSAGFSFRTPTIASGSMPFASASGSTSTPTTLLPDEPVSRLTSNAGFRSGAPSNDQMSLKDSRADRDLQTAQMDPTSGQPSNFQAIHSGTQAFQFGNFQNNSAKSPPFQESGNVGFSPGGSFSLGSGGTEKSERKFIRVRRDKRRK